MGGVPARVPLRSSMNIHLGHHFFGAGNLGDDLMLAGFLTGMSEFLPAARFTCSIPFPPEPSRRRFPQITWLPYDEAARERAIAEADVWLGLGGSPFQSALSRWFVDHLGAEAGFCRRHGKPMYFLGVGVQDATETADETVRTVCAGARHIWTRDAGSAERLLASRGPDGVTPSADLSHLFLARCRPPAARAGRLCVVLNFDHRKWDGRDDALAGLEVLGAKENVWLVQESRQLAGAELDLHASLDERRQAYWKLTQPEKPGAPLESVIADWPTGEWLLTARYHSALLGAWAGSKIVVVGINEKLKSVAREICAPTVTEDSATDEVIRALRVATVNPAPLPSMERARAACLDFVQRAGSGT